MLGMSPAVFQGLQEMREMQAGKPATTIEMTRDEFIEYGKRAGLDATDIQIGLHMLAAGAQVGAGHRQYIKLKS